MKASKLMLGGVSGVLVMVGMATGIDIKAEATPEGTRSYWRVGASSSLEFTEAVLAERVDEESYSPLSLRTGAVPLGEKFICNLHIAHPAPEEVISVSVIDASGKVLLKEPAKIPEEAAGRRLWLSYRGQLSKPGRYTCRFTHGDLVREVPFEVAEPASASNASPAHPCGS